MTDSHKATIAADSKTNTETAPLLATDNKAHSAEFKPSSSFPRHVGNRPLFLQELKDNLHRLDVILRLEEGIKDPRYTELQRSAREHMGKELLEELKKQHNKVFYEVLGSAAATHYFSGNPEKRQLIKQYLEACYTLLARDLIDNRSMETYAYFPQTVNDAKKPIASVFKECTDVFGTCTTQGLSISRARASLFFCGQKLNSVVSDSYDPPSLRCTLTTLEFTVAAISACAGLCALGSGVPPSLMLLMALLSPNAGVSLMVGTGLYYSSETTRNKLNMIQYIFDHYQQLNNTVLQEQLKHSASATGIMTREDSTPSLRLPR